jgi:hypothetical protein
MSAGRCRSISCFAPLRLAPAVLFFSLLAASAQYFHPFAPGVGYANVIVREPPWSIQLVRVDRSSGETVIQSSHAKNGALGLSPLSDQIRSAPAGWGTALAGVNGDFYQRENSRYAGDPRGLQIVAGELISGPADSATFWIDPRGGLHTARTQSQFEARFADGTALPFGLNEERNSKTAVLYTPAAGASTRTRNDGVELVLERDGESIWLPLKVGETFRARVREVRPGGNTKLAPEAMVLSLGPSLTNKLGALKAGDVVTLTTATTPDLRGARTALSGGPVLVTGGKKQDWLKDAKPVGPTGNYSVRSMSERHPRSALGWNEKFFYIIQVDGRHPNSVGMTLDELAQYMMKIGCTEVMNLDGGGSATFWVNGRVVNEPADRVERPIANALLIFQAGTRTAATIEKQKAPQ